MSSYGTYRKYLNLFQPAFLLQHWNYTFKITYKHVNDVLKEGFYDEIA